MKDVILATNLSLAFNQKANVERLARQLEAQLQELSSKLDESARSFGDATSQNNRLRAENSSLLAQLSEVESQVGGFGKVKQQLNAAVEEARRQVDEEARAKASLAQQLRNVSGDFAAARGELEEEVARRGELQKVCFSNYFIFFK